jgi:16S rRNA (guanine527-N7)-methyltransferase
MEQLNLLLRYFPSLSDVQKEQFVQMGLVYTEWNQKINVISRQDIGELYVRHVLHSLAIAKYVEFVPGTKIVDVGCGGGFPGIPLAVLFPEVEFTLVDSIGKKITVVNEVSKEIGLINVKGLNDRAEKLKEKYDFIVSRAVTAFPKFVALTRNLISKQQKNAIPNGIIYLKGGDFNDEVKPFAKLIEIKAITDYFNEPFFETKKVIYLPL